MNDKPPQDAEILEVVGNGVSPSHLIETLVGKGYPLDDVIEAIQRAVEREKIALDSTATVVAVAHYANAA
jgi:DNA-binding winged helix-turn-helix (wHTH) protein